jgi:hypothetical protein
MRLNASNLSSTTSALLTTPRSDTDSPALGQQPSFPGSQNTVARASSDYPEALSQRGRLGANRLHKMLAEQQKAASSTTPSPVSNMPAQSTEMSPTESNRALMSHDLRLPEPANIAGLNVVLIGEHDDPKFELKKACLETALEKIRDKVPNAYAGMPELTVYMGSKLPCEACWEPSEPGGRAALFLGDRMMFDTNRVDKKQIEAQIKADAFVDKTKSNSINTNDVKNDARIWAYGEKDRRGVADQVYDTKRKSVMHPVRWMQGEATYQESKTSAKGAAAVVHEIGHLIHEHRSKNEFWEHKKKGADIIPSTLSKKISSYAFNNNYDELVAEVFTGLVHGKTYTQDVMAAYKAMGGPEMKRS